MMKPGYTLAEITRLEDLERIEPEWRALWARDPRATPFQSPDWLLPWTRRLWGGGKLYVLEIRRDSQLISVAPLFVWGVERMHLSFLGSGISDYLGMTCDPESAADAASLALRWISENRGNWDICDLQELRDDAALLEAASREKSELHILPCSICPVAPLPATMEDYLAALDGKFRHNLHSAGRRLEAAGKVEFVSSGDHNWSELLDHLFRLHATRWHDKNRSGMLSSESLQLFHHDVAGRFWEGVILRMYGLLVDGACIAVQYNFISKRRAYAYLSGFDTAWKRVSPGSLLLAHSIRHAIREGAREFDFLRKPEPFKYSWGAKDENTRRLVAIRGAAQGSLTLEDADAAVPLENRILDLV
jgi:CelD/BcsL family acetyltransferase involved in cellulose biosynthesis